MELVVKRVYMRRFKAKARSFRFKDCKKDVLKYVFEFLNVKELVKFLMVSKLIAEISKFGILKKYISVKK
jgi:hypothetical protein